MLDGIGDLSIVRADSGANPNHTAHFCTSCQMHTQRWQAIKKKTQMELYRPENRMWMKKMGNIIPVWVWSTNRKYENAYQMHKFCSISSHNTQFTRPTKWWEIINNRGQFQIKIDVLFSSDIPYYFRKVMRQFTHIQKHLFRNDGSFFFSLTKAQFQLHLWSHTQHFRWYKCFRSHLKCKLMHSYNFNCSSV